MAIFRLYNSDVSIEHNGQQYDFDQVDSLVIENPETTRLVRGADARDKVGLVFKEGIKEPKRATVTLLGITSDMYSLLTGVFDDKSRVKVSLVDRLDGSSMIFKQAILCKTPLQLTVDESPESINVVLEFESFDLSVGHKS